MYDRMNMRLGSKVKDLQTGEVYRVLRYAFSPQGTTILAQLGNDPPREFRPEQVDVEA